MSTFPPSVVTIKQCAIIHLINDTVLLSSVVLDYVSVYEPLNPSLGKGGISGGGGSVLSAATVASLSRGAAARVSVVAGGV